LTGVRGTGLKAALPKLADLPQRPAADLALRVEQATTRLELATGVVARVAGGVGAELHLADAIIVGIAPSLLALAPTLLADSVLAAGGTASAAATGALGARADETALSRHALQSEMGQRPEETDARQDA